MDELFSNRFSRVSRLSVVSTKGADEQSYKGALEILFAEFKKLSRCLSGVLVCIPEVCSVTMNKEHQYGELNNAFPPPHPRYSLSNSSMSSFIFYKEITNRRIREGLFFKPLDVKQ